MSGRGGQRRAGASAEPPFTASPVHSAACWVRFVLRWGAGAPSGGHSQPEAAAPGVALGVELGPEVRAWGAGGDTGLPVEAEGRVDGPRAAGEAGGLENPVYTSWSDEGRPWCAHWGASRLGPLLAHGTHTVPARQPRASGGCGGLCCDSSLGLRGHTARRRTRPRHTHVHAHTSSHTHMHAHMHALMLMHTHTRTHEITHTCTHAHTSS